MWKWNLFRRAILAIVLIILNSCFAQYGEDLPSVPESSATAHAGTHISIHNPHSKGISPTLPPSSIPYYAPPEIPRPDFSILAKEKEEAHSFASASSSSSDSASSQSELKIQGKKPLNAKFTIRNLGQHPNIPGFDLPHLPFISSQKSSSSSSSSSSSNSSSSSSSTSEKSTSFKSSIDDNNLILEEKKQIQKIENIVPAVEKPTNSEYESGYAPQTSKATEVLATKNEHNTELASRISEATKTNEVLKGESTNSVTGSVATPSEAETSNISSLGPTDTVAPTIKNNQNEIASESSASGYASKTSDSSKSVIPGESSAKPIDVSSEKLSGYEVTNTETSTTSGTNIQTSANSVEVAPVNNGTPSSSSETIGKTSSTISETATASLLSVGSNTATSGSNLKTVDTVPSGNSDSAPGYGPSVSSGTSDFAPGYGSSVSSTAPESLSSSAASGKDSSQTLSSSSSESKQVEVAPANEITNTESASSGLGFATAPKTESSQSKHSSSANNESKENVSSTSNTDNTISKVSSINSETSKITSESEATKNENELIPNITDSDSAPGYDSSSSNKDFSNSANSLSSETHSSFYASKEKIVPSLVVKQPADVPSSGPYYSATYSGISNKAHLGLNTNLEGNVVPENTASSSSNSLKNTESSSHIESKTVVSLPNSLTGPIEEISSPNETQIKVEASKTDEEYADEKSESHTSEHSSSLSSSKSIYENTNVDAPDISHPEPEIVPEKPKFQTVIEVRNEVETPNEYSPDRPAPVQPAQIQPKQTRPAPIQNVIPAKIKHEEFSYGEVVPQNNINIPIKVQPASVVPSKIKNEETVGSDYNEETNQGTENIPPPSPPPPSPTKHLISKPQIRIQPVTVKPSPTQQPQQKISEYNSGPQTLRPIVLPPPQQPQIQPNNFNQQQYNNQPPQYPQLVNPQQNFNSFATGPKYSTGYQLQSQQQYVQQWQPQQQQWQPPQQQQQQQGCCGGRWFSQQGGLCAPVNYNSCQQQNYAAPSPCQSGCNACSQQQAPACGQPACPQPICPPPPCTPIAQQQCCCAQQSNSCGRKKRFVFARC